MKLKKSFILTLLLMNIIIFSSILRIESTETNDFSIFNIYDVPFTYQNDDYLCGPATLTMILNYWGVNITQEEVVIRVYDSATNLSTISQMKAYVEEIGFKTQELISSVTTLKDQIKKGYPRWYCKGFRYKIHMDITEL